MGVRLRVTKDLCAIAQEPLQATQDARGKVGIAAVGEQDIFSSLQTE